MSSSTISYAVNGKQYVMVFTGEGQSVSAGPLGLTQKSMPKAVRGHTDLRVRPAIAHPKAPQSAGKATLSPRVMTDRRLDEDEIGDASVTSNV